MGDTARAGLQRLADQQAERIPIVAAGRERSAVVVGRARPVADAPAILYFHGSNQTAASGRAFTGGTFDALTARGGVVAYLDGYKRNWNMRAPRPPSPRAGTAWTTWRSRPPRSTGSSPTMASPDRASTPSASRRAGR